MAHEQDEYVVWARRTVNGLTEVRQFIKPAGVSMNLNEVHPFLRYGYLPYAGQEMTDCIMIDENPDPDPVSVDPALTRWRDDFTLPNYSPGGVYEVYITRDGAGIKGTGLTILNVLPLNLPEWANREYVLYENGDLGIRSSKAPSADAGKQLFRLYLRDSGGHDVIKSFEISPITIQVYGFIQDDPTNGFRIYVGGDAGVANKPKIKVKKAPAGWSDFNQYEMPDYGAGVLGGKEFFYRWINYPAGFPGDYVFEVDHAGQIIYLYFTRTGSFKEETPFTSAVAPDAAPDEINAFSVTMSAGNIPTLTITATSEPKIWIKGTSSNYDSGFKGTTLIGPTGQNTYQFRFYGAAALAAGSYKAHAELINGRGNVSEFNFNVEAAVSSGTGGSGGNGGSTNPGQIAKVAYSWNRNNPPTVLSVVNIYVQTSGIDLEIALWVTNYDGTRIGTKSAYTAMNSGSFGGGLYDKTINLNAANSQTTLTIYLRKVGSTADLVTMDLPTFPSSGTIPITAVYTATVPPSGPVDASDQAGDTDPNFFTAPN